MQNNSKYKIAAAYAEAWFGAAEEKNSEDEVFADVKLIQESLKNDAALWKKMISLRASAQLVDEVAKKAKLSEISKNALKLMTENGYLNLLGQITDNFVHLFYKKKGIIEVSVDTAVALSAAQDKKLRKVLKDKLQSEIELTYRIKPEVLGGLAVRFNSFLIDDTIAHKLKKFEKLMTEN